MPLWLIIIWFLLKPTAASRYKYPVETYTAITKDKYVLEMHRIPHGKEKPDSDAPRFQYVNGVFSNKQEQTSLKNSAKKLLNLTRHLFDNHSADPSSLSNMVC